MNRSIVINREFGSGGREIGRMISERAGMELYDSRVLEDAAATGGLPGGLLAEFDEVVVSGPYFDLSPLAIVDQESYALPYRVYSAIADVITGAARSKPAVFVGRCADRILADAGVPFRSVFIYSTDVEAKIARAVELDGVARGEAEKYIARMDKTRARYQQFFTGTQFGDRREYDLCLNSGRLGYRACVEIILTATAAESAPGGSTGTH